MCLDWVFFTLTGFALFVIAGVGVVIASFLDPKTRSASVVAVLVLATGGLSYLWFRRASGD